MAHQDDNIKSNQDITNYFFRFRTLGQDGDLLERNVATVVGRAINMCVFSKSIGALARHNMYCNDVSRFETAKIPPTALKLNIIDTSRTFS